MRHPSTPADRLPWIGRLLADRGRYGVVTDLSRQTGVPRQTLTTWREDGRQTLLTALEPAPSPAGRSDAVLARAVLTLLIRGHASLRGIQTCLAELWGRPVGLGTIQAIVAEAGRRAQACLGTLVPPAPCALALDEVFGSDAQGAYLSAVDARAGVVWATAGPVAPDTESWTLVLWDITDRGGRWALTLHDGGYAAALGAAAADPSAPCARDVWHVLARWGQTQHRLDRRVAEATAKLAIRDRYEAGVATGRRTRGKPPTTDAATQAAAVAAETALAEAVRFLGHEVHEALEVVVRRRGYLLDAAARRQDLEAALALLAELIPTAPGGARTDLTRLHTHTAQALPALLTFAALLDPVQATAIAKLGATAVGLLGWAWQRRAVLELDDAGIVAGVPAAWQAAARVLLYAWSSTVRTTSLAESWHSLVRAHLAVHRGLPPGVLALLAVWHNHRVVPRGAYAGTSPLQRCGLAETTPDWLTALGYPPATAAAAPPATLRMEPPIAQEVAA